MPIYLRAPEAPAGGPDGKGWNRLSLNSHGGFLAQCALRPRRWGALLESQDTRRARWGGFGACFNRGNCEDCTLRKAINEQPTTVEVNAPPGPGAHRGDPRGGRCHVQRRTRRLAPVGHDRP